MNKILLDIINFDFKEEEKEFVILELYSIGLKHVWESSINLERARLSILKLAKGDVNEVVNLTRQAKFDFRDVIMWADETQ